MPTAMPFASAATVHRAFTALVLLLRLAAPRQFAAMDRQWQHVQEFRWSGPPRTKGEATPTHLVMLTTSDTAESLERQLRLIFNVQPAAHLLLFNSVDVNGTQRMVLINLAGLIHRVQQYYAHGGDAAPLQTGSVVFVQCTQAAEAAVDCAMGESRLESSGAKRRSSASGSGSDYKPREHKEWKQLSDELWPMHIPRCVRLLRFTCTRVHAACHPVQPL